MFSCPVISTLFPLGPDSKDYTPNMETVLHIIKVDFRLFETLQRGLLPSRVTSEPEILENLEKTLNQHSL